MTLTFGGEDVVVASGQVSFYDRNYHKFKGTNTVNCQTYLIFQINYISSFMPGSLNFSSPKFPWLNFIANFGLDLHVLTQSEMQGDDTLVDLQISPNSIHQFPVMGARVAILGLGLADAQGPLTLAFRAEVPQAVEGTLTLHSWQARWATFEFGGLFCVFCA